MNDVFYTCTSAQSHPSAASHCGAALPTGRFSSGGSPAKYKPKTHGSNTIKLLTESSHSPHFLSIVQLILTWLLSSLVELLRLSLVFVLELREILETQNSFIRPGSKDNNLSKNLPLTGSLGKLNNFTISSRKVQSCGQFKVKQ